MARSRPECVYASVVQCRTWFACVILVCWILAQAEGGAAAVLGYEALDTATQQRLFTVWGWTEDDCDDGARVAALSDTVFPSGGDVRTRAWFTRDTPPRCLSWESTARNRNGAVIVTHASQWAAEVFPLLTQPFPADTYPLEAPIGFVFPRLGLEHHGRASFHTMLGNTLAQIDLWVDGDEAIEVPAGRFVCHRVRMRANPHSLFPHLPAFLKPVLSFFIPTYTLWLSTGEPPAVIQFSGQMGPPGSPQLLIRLIEMH